MNNLNIVRDKNVFVIDDDENFLDLIKFQLKEVEGVNFHYATDSNIGFRMILYYKPDLLILDMVLPDSDGLKLSKAIEIIAESSIPTIFISADENNFKKINQSDFKAPITFLKKPLNKEELLETMNNYLVFHKVDDRAGRKKIHFTRPKPIKWIGTIQLLEPLIKILTLKLSTTFDFMTIFNNVTTSDSYKALFDFWFLFPLGGLALLSVRKFSYFFFLGVQIYSIINYFMYEPYSWPYLQKDPHLFSTIILLLNIGVIIYFLLPESRRPFFDPKVRGWEKGPRFKFNLPCRVFIGKKPKADEAELVDISNSGACICFGSDQNIGENIKVELSFYHLNFALNAKIVVHHEELRKNCYGISFNMIQYGDRKNLKKLIHALHVLSN